jgi:hypothetical protein
VGALGATSLSELSSEEQLTTVVTNKNTAVIFKNFFMLFLD